MATASTTRRASDAALRRVPIVRAVGGPGEVRDAVTALDRARRREGNGRLVRDLALAVPWTVVLLARLVRDGRVAMRHRAALVAVVAYLLTPLDPIPDFLPVIGALDDALVAAVVVRWVVRSVDPDVVEDHWPGTPEVLEALRDLSGAAR